MLVTANAHSGRSLRDHFFFLRRTALNDRPKGPPTANRQLPSTANRHQPPATNRRQPPAATNRQLPTTANRHQPPTAANHHQTPPIASCQLPTANRQLPSTANRHQPPATNRCQPPAATNRQLPTTANRHQLPTATNHGLAHGVPAGFFGKTGSGNTFFFPLRTALRTLDDDLASGGWHSLTQAVPFACCRSGLGGEAPVSG